MPAVLINVKYIKHMNKNRKAQMSQTWLALKQLNKNMFGLFFFFTCGLISNQIPTKKHTKLSTIISCQKKSKI